MVDLQLGITRLAANLGVSFENLIIILFIAGALVMFIKDFKIGLIMLFLGSGCILLWFTAWGLALGTITVIFFMSLVIMAITLYTVNKTVQGAGGGIL